MFDGDDAGHEFIKAIADRGFSAQELGQRCGTHAAGDLEAQLVADGLGPELRAVLATLGIRNAQALNDGDLIARLRDRKAAYAAGIAARVLQDAGVAQRTPEAFRATVGRLRGQT